MRTHTCALWVTLFGQVFIARAADRAESSPAQQFVRAALEAEAAGNSESYRNNLRESLRQDIDFAPAHWHSGEVQMGDDWVTADQAIKRFKASPAVLEYIALRENAENTVDEHLRLARWCRDHDLADSAGAHARAALILDPNSRDARKELGLVSFQGAWVTKDQAQAANKFREQVADTIRTWKPALLRLKKQFASSNAATRAEARSRVLEIDDLAAIPALEMYLSPANSEAAGAVVALLAESPQAESTRSLIRHAVLSQFESVRQDAAQALVKRPLHSWAPVILSAMEPPVEVRYQYNLEQFAASGSISVFREGPFADEIQSLGITFPALAPPPQSPAAAGVARSLGESVVDRAR